MKLALTVEQHEVDLPDGDTIETYRLLPVVRSIMQRVDVVIEKLTAAEDVDGLVDAYGALFDLRLEQTRPKQPKASTLLRRAWKANRIDFKSIQTLLEDIKRLDAPAVDEDGRPT